MVLRGRKESVISETLHALVKEKSFRGVDKLRRWCMRKLKVKYGQVKRWCIRKLKMKYGQVKRWCIRKLKMQYEQVKRMVHA